MAEVSARVLTSSRATPASRNGSAPPRGEAAVVRAQQHPEVHVAERRGQVLVEHPHHLLGRDAVGAALPTKAPALVPT